MKPPRSSPPVSDAGSTICGRWRSGCRGRVPGIDCQRTCDACQAAGHPPRVEWSEAKPDGLGCDGTTVLELANAHLINAPRDDARSDLAADLKKKE